MNKTSQYQFTVIVPLYNEEDNIASLEKRLSAWLPTSPRKACVLFVDDGSTDRSLALLKEVCTRHEEFCYISLQSNSGLTAALRAGLRHTESPLAGYIDADLQTTPEDFNILLPYADDYQLVTGIRAERHDSLFKKLQSRIANSFRRSMTHDGVKDTGCPLKVMHTDMARDFPLFTGMHRFLPALTIMTGGKVKQIPVRHFERTAGVSKYHLWNRLKGPFMDCFAYRWMRKRYVNPKVDQTNL